MDGEDGGSAEHVIPVTGQRPGHIARANRAPLCLVGIKQGITGLAARHHRKLPREIVRVLDSGI